MKNEVKLFVPCRFAKREINENQISRMFEAKANYVSKGRYAIIHILRSHGILDGKVGISAYMCPTVCDVLKNHGYDVVYYDIELSDLNPNVHSIEGLISLEHPKAVVIPSMYGNPANLSEIERVCKSSKTIMIDDAAQAFGACIDNRYAGSFGDGGFFSFSPGKPTAAHRGGFFWTSKDYTIKRTSHLFVALVNYKDFLYRRYYAYEHHNIKRFIWKTLNIGISFLPLNTRNDRLERFEYDVLGGVLYSNLNDAISYRSRWLGVFNDIFVSKDCYLVTGVREARTNCCKIVYVFNDKKSKEMFTKYLTEHRIAFYGGYSIPSEARHCPNALRIEDMVVELSIDPYEEKMQYLCKCIRNYEK